MIKYGIIGVGAIAYKHIEAIQKIPQIEIKGLCDPQEENISKILKTYPQLRGAELFSDYRLLLESPEIDAVLICTPNHTHAEITVNALEAGKHVLCEKPMAITLEDCYLMVEMERKSGKVLEIGFKFRYSSLFKTIKKMIEEGKIGKVRMMWASEFRKPFLGSWRKIKEKSGGPFVEESVHFFDLFNWLSGSVPLKVCSFGGRDVLRDFQGVDNAYILVEYREGIRANLGFCCFTNPSKLDFLIIGEEGRLESNLFSSSIICFDKEGKKEEISLSQTDPGFLGEHEEFISCIEKGSKPLTSGEESLKAMLIAFYAEESIKKEKVISFKQKR